MKIKKGDIVTMITGKDKGKSGKVIKALPKENKIIVEGANTMKKHMRPRKSGEKGQMLTISRAVSVSNAKLICPKCNKATRVGYTVVNNKKIRVCKQCAVSFQ